MFNFNTKNVLGNIPPASLSQDAELKQMRYYAEAERMVDLHWTQYDAPDGEFLTAVGRTLDWIDSL